MKKNYTDEEILLRVKLIMGYNPSKTLNENLDIIKPITEAPFSTELLGALSKDVKLLDDALRLIPTGLKTADGIAIRNGGQLARAMNAGKLAETQLGSLRTGLLKTGTLDDGLKNLLINHLLETSGAYNKYRAYANQSDIKAELKRVGYPDPVAEDIANAIKNKQRGVSNAPVNKPHTNEPLVGEIATAINSQNIINSVDGLIGQYGSKFPENGIISKWWKGGEKYKDQKYINLVITEMKSLPPTTTQSQLIDLVNKRLADYMANPKLTSTAREEFSGLASMLNGVKKTGNVIWKIVGILALVTVLGLGYLGYTAYQSTKKFIKGGEELLQTGKDIKDKTYGVFSKILGGGTSEYENTAEGLRSYLKASWGEFPVDNVILTPIDENNWKIKIPPTKEYPDGFEDQVGTYANGTFTTK